MKPLEMNMLRCVDEDHHKKLIPLLERLGIHAVKVRKEKGFQFSRIRAKSHRAMVIQCGAFIWKILNKKTPRQSISGPHDECACEGY
jgi:hypothetical protein